jgi:hypothetical protein
MAILHYSVPVALVAATILLVDVISASSSASVFTAGVAAQKVVALDRDTFIPAISDPANSFWFLKFYAPWFVIERNVCGIWVNHLSNSLRLIV